MAQPQRCMMVVTALIATTSVASSAPPVGAQQMLAASSATSVGVTGDVFTVSTTGVAHLSVTLTSPDPSCLGGRPARFRADLDASGVIEADEMWTVTTSASGVASTSVTGLAPRAYQVVAEVDATPACDAAAIAFDLLVADAATSTRGIGRYVYPNIGAAHLQFHSRVVTASSTAPASGVVRGGVTWRIDRLVRFHGTVTGVTTWCPSGVITLPGARCGLLVGTGTVWRWSSAGRGGWVREEGTVPFTLLVEDGAPDGNHGRGRHRGEGDRVRMYLPGFEFLSKTAALLPSTCGDLVVR